MENEEKLHVDDDTGDQLEIVSLHDPMRADEFSVLQKSPLIMKRKSQNTPLTLESLKKIVLDLKNSLTINNKKKNALSRGNVIILAMIFLLLYCLYHDQFFFKRI